MSTPDERIKSIEYLYEQLSNVQYSPRSVWTDNNQFVDSYLNSKDNFVIEHEFDSEELEFKITKLPVIGK